jgi:RNA-binding protein
VPLTGKQRRALRAKGHHLDPVVITGQSGITEGVLSAVSQALKDHELIKVKVHEGPETRQEAAAKMAEGTGSELVQLLGRTVLLLKVRDEDSQFEEFSSQPRKPAPAKAASKAASKAATRTSTRRAPPRAVRPRRPSR